MLYEVICALLICTSGSTGLHDEQDLKELMKLGFKLFIPLNEVVFSIYKTIVCTQIVHDKNISSHMFRRPPAIIRE